MSWHELSKIESNVTVLNYFNFIMECLEMSLKVCGVFSCGVVTVPKFQYSVPIPVKIHGSRYQSKTQKHANKKKHINEVKLK